MTAASRQVNCALQYGLANRRLWLSSEKLTREEFAQGGRQKWSLSNTKQPEKKTSVQNFSSGNRWNDISRHATKNRGADLAGEVMANLCCDTEGILFVEFRDRERERERERCHTKFEAICWHWVKTTNSKWPAKQGPPLHGNTKPYTSLHTTEAVAKAGWTVLRHPPRSPHFAPYDFHLFGPWKVHFDDAVLRTTMSWNTARVKSSHWSKDFLCDRQTASHWKVVKVYW